MGVTNAEQIREEIVLDALVDLHDMFPRYMSGLSAEGEAALVRHLEERAKEQLAR